MFISYLVPGYLKGRFCYLRGFYLEINEHRPKKKNTNNASKADILISDGQDRAFDPHRSWAIYHETHVFATVIRSFHCFKIGSYKFLAEGCSVYWLTTYCISMPPLYWRDSSKMLFPIPFRTDQARKAIAVNSLLSQLQLAPLKQ